MEGRREILKNPPFLLFGNFGSSRWLLKLLLITIVCAVLGAVVGGLVSYISSKRHMKDQIDALKKQTDAQKSQAEAQKKQADALSEIAKKQGEQINILKS